PAPSPPQAARVAAAAAPAAPTRNVLRLCMGFLLEIARLPPADAGEDARCPSAARRPGPTEQRCGVNQWNANVHIESAVKMETVLASHNSATFCKPLTGSSGGMDSRNSAGTADNEQRSHPSPGGHRGMDQPQRRPSMADVASRAGV